MTEFMNKIISLFTFWHLVFLIFALNSPVHAQDLILGGKKYFTIEKGEQNATTLVILHGLPDSSIHQRRLIDGLADKYHVFAFDRLGMGLSEKPIIDYSFENQVDEIDAVLRAKQIDKFILLGHSVGGGLAVAYAQKYPEHVQALILMNATLIFERGHTGLKDIDTWFLKLPLLGETFMAFHNRAVVRQVLKVMFYDDAKITDKMVDEYFSFLNSRGAKRHFLATLRDYYRMPSRDLVEKGAQVAKRGTPILLLWTENDEKVPFTDAEDIAKQWGANLRAVPHCGHLPQLELSDADFSDFVIMPLVEFVAGLK